MKAKEKVLIEKNKKEVEKNKKEGDAFLAENKKKEGVKTTATGLQYKVIKEGTGAMPAATDTVTVRYRGSLINGTEFDNSEKHGGPGTVTFPIGGVIPGWTEALKMMKVGSKWQVFIPAKLAYGERGRPGIPPNSTLIFEVELISIKPAEQKPAASSNVQGTPKPQGQTSKDQVKGKAAAKPSDNGAKDEK